MSRRNTILCKIDINFLSIRPALRPAAVPRSLPATRVSRPPRPIAVPAALRCPKKSSRCSLARFFRPLRVLRLAASATGGARLRTPYPSPVAGEGPSGQITACSNFRLGSVTLCGTTTRQNIVPHPRTATPFIPNFISPLGPVFLPRKAAKEILGQVCNRLQRRRAF